MRIKLLALILAIVACLLAVAIVVPLYAHVNAQVRSTSSSGSPNIPITIPNAPAGSPHFTVADVKEYLSTHQFPSGPTTTGQAPKILRIAFMTSKEASQLMGGDSTGLKDNALVCYVELYGPFAMKNASLPYGAKPLQPSNRGIEIFDATTGHLIDWWAPDTN